MNRFILAGIAGCLLATSVLAQGPDGPATSAQYLYFSTRFAETAASGRGGHIIDIAPPTHPLVMGQGFVNEAAVLNSEGLGVVRPGAPNKTPIAFSGCANPPLCPPPPAAVVDLMEISNFPQMNLIVGDVDNDAIYNEATPNFGGIDAVYIPFPPADRAAGIHDCFVSSFGDSSGVSGYRGTSITEADMVLFPSAANFYATPSTPQSPIFFIRQSHLETFFGMAAGTGNSMDIDAFGVDQSTGDIYLSFDGASGTNPTPAFTATFLTGPGTPFTGSVHAGDIFRIPGGAYTPSGVFSVVTAPVGGLVERVYTAAHVTAMVTAAGGCIGSATAGGAPVYVNTYGLDLDFTTGLGTTTPTGFTVRHLFFNIDNRGFLPSGGCPGAPSQNFTATALYTTQGGGTFAVLNGTIMDTPNAAGLDNVSFNAAFFTGPFDAVDVIELATAYDPVTAGPFHLDSFPDSGFTLNGATPTPVVTGYVAGATPGGTVAILMRVDLKVAGGFIDRYSTGALGIISGYPDLFIDVLGINNANFIMGPAFLAPYGQDPFVQSLFNGGPGFADWNPIVTFTDVNVTPQTNNGDSAFSLDLTSLVGQVPFGFVLTFQALDVSSLKLSDPLSFEFN